MEDAERKALRALKFDWAPTSDDVWRRSPYHVGDLHSGTRQAILDAFEETGPDSANPVGVVVLGPRGSGKTHLLGAVREQVQHRGGYFFLVSLLDAGSFWRSVALSMTDGFSRTLPDGSTQLQKMLRELLDRVGAPRAVRRALTEETDSGLGRATLDAFIDMLRKTDRQVGLECQDTARALALFAARDFGQQNIGYDFLCGNEEVEDGDRSTWGIRHNRRSAQEIVRDMSRIIALAGPTLIAVDQIDQLVAQSMDQLGGEKDPTRAPSLLLEQVAGGLMSLREMTRRTLSVVACLSSSWELIINTAIDTAQDRFSEPLRLKPIPSEGIGQELVAKRFATCFDTVSFTPPFATWPVAPEAFTEAVDFSPRELLRAVDVHVKGCLKRGKVRELRSLKDPTVQGNGVPKGNFGHGRRAELDRRFEALRREADPGPALDQKTEDEVVPRWLGAGLTAWIAEHDPSEKVFSLDAPWGAKPALHGRLRRVLDEESEDEGHWAFRAVAATHHISALNRIRNAVTAAGLAVGVPKRQLFLLRNARWNSGPRTSEVVAAFEAAGGRTLPLVEDDVRSLIALDRLARESAEDDEGLRDWLAQRQPTREIAFLREALADAAQGLDQATSGGPSTAIGTATVPAPVAESPERRVAAWESAAALEDPARVVVGTVEGTGRPVTIELEALRRHTAVFAGSGSGKTVLIRRLVEECALKGVSTIVLDPNNDLARLGDAWPEPPDGWLPGDPERAARYLDAVDVVVWTPRRAAGRPLSFQPLPNFADVLDDPDEFAAAVDAAVAALVPRAKLEGSTNKAHLSQAVLRQALTHYARTGRSNLREFIGLLSDLPDEVSEMDNAAKLAGELSQTLMAATVNDPMFGGSGVPVDPQVLLTPEPGKQARISVISFIGLPTEEQRQSFVNQLQLALFGWVKRHPAGDRPLGALLVMDEAQTFAPSGAMTACTRSTLALASQARKYGLGLVFATQAPKGLDNKISGNASTQLFGLLNSPVQIAAGREMARAKGGDVSDIARLTSGQFYAAVEGSPFLRMRAPMCLSHHPRSPLVSEEVLRRATQ